MTRGGGVSGNCGRINGRHVSGMHLLDTEDAFVGVQPTVPPPIIHTEPTHVSAPHAVPTLAPSHVSHLDNDEGVADQIWDATEREVLKVNRKIHTGELIFDGIEATRSLRPIFRLDIVKGAINWSNVPMEKKDFYFQEFRKKFKWRKGQGSIVRSTWEEVANYRYRELIHECKEAWKANNAVKIPRGFTADVCKSFTDYWSQPDVQHSSEQHAANRRGGRAVAPATHTGGSITHCLHAKRKAIKNDGKMPTQLDMFEDMHTMKVSKMPCNSKAANVIAECKKRKEEAEEEATLLPQQVGSSSNETDTQVNVNKIFFQVLKDVAGGPNKGRWYGAAAETSATPIGGLDETIPTSLVSAGYSDELKQVIDQILDVKLAERDARLLQQLTELIQGQNQMVRTSTSGGRNSEDDTIDGGNKRMGDNNVVHIDREGEDDSDGNKL